MNDKKNGISLRKFLGDIDVARTTGYRWIIEYADELQKLGLIDIKRRGKTKRIIVYEPEKIIAFFRDKDIYLKED